MRYFDEKVPNQPRKVNWLEKDQKFPTNYSPFLEDLLIAKFYRDIF
jgi:hypothetical protein